jgi:hypothetical protein
MFAGGCSVAGLVYYYYSVYMIEDRNNQYRIFENIKTRKKRVSLHRWPPHTPGQPKPKEKLFSTKSFS